MSLNLSLKTTLECYAKLKAFFFLYKRQLCLFPSILSILIAAALLPIIGSSWYGFYRYQQLKEAEEKIEQLEMKAKKSASIRAKESDFMKKLKEGDPVFLKKQLDGLKFLQKEQHCVSQLLEDKALFSSLSLIQRDRDLDTNRCVFEHDIVSQNQNMEERLYNLAYPVEMDKEDLKAFLEIVELPSYKMRPPMYFKKFTINKKNITDNYFVYEVDCAILQRNLKGVL